MRTFIGGNLQCLYKKRWPKLALYVVVDGLKCDRKVFVEKSSVDMQDLQKSGNFNLILLAPVVRKVDCAIHRINHSPFDSAIGSAMTYPLDSDLSG